MKVNCIMLIDDNVDDNFFHERVIKKHDAANHVISMTLAEEALVYLKGPKGPEVDLIFLDINMPRMNGWEFLEAYAQLDESIRRQVIMIMLTTSENPDDIARADEKNVAFSTKPLTKALLDEALQKCHERRLTNGTK